MTRGEYRGYKAIWTVKDVDQQGLEKIIGGWMRRKGDPCSVLEAFQIRDGFELRGLFVIDRQTTEAVLRGALEIPDNATVTPLTSVVRVRLLAENISEDKTGRVLWVCKGW